MRPIIVSLVLALTFGFVLFVQAEKESKKQPGFNITNASELEIDVDYTAVTFQLSHGTEHEIESISLRNSRYKPIMTVFPDGKITLRGKLIGSDPDVFTAAMKLRLLKCECEPIAKEFFENRDNP